MRALTYVGGPRTQQTSLTGPLKQATQPPLGQDPLPTTPQELPQVTRLPYKCKSEYFLVGWGILQTEDIGVARRYDMYSLR